MKGKVFAFMGLALVGLGLGNSVAQAPEWERTFGGGNWNEGASVQQTRDGGYILVGTTCSFGIEGSCDVWLVKYRP